MSADSRSDLFLFCSLCSDISVGSDSVSARHSSSHRIKSFESLSCQTSLGRSSKLLQNQFRSLVRSALTVAPFTLYEKNPTLSWIDPGSFWKSEKVVAAFRPRCNDPASNLGNLGLVSPHLQRESRPIKLPDHVDVPACHVLIRSLGRLSTGCHCGSRKAARAPLDLPETDV